MHMKKLQQQGKKTKTINNTDILGELNPEMCFIKISSIHLYLFLLHMWLSPHPVDCTMVGINTNQYVCFC